MLEFCLPAMDSEWRYFPGPLPHSLEVWLRYRSCVKLVWEGSATDGNQLNMSSLSGYDICQITPFHNSQLKQM